MPFKTRREFLKISARLAGATTAAALFPDAIRRALAIEPATVTGTIQDVRHIVVFMQENRSFDHYYGTLRGVRGFNDPRPIYSSATGYSVWQQSQSPIVNNIDGAITGEVGALTDGVLNNLAPYLPGSANNYGSTPLSPNGATVDGYVLPFHASSKTTSVMCDGQLFMEHGDDIAIWNRGNLDGWATPRHGIFPSPSAMIHLDRDDLPFYYALADAFTICDYYFCSSMTPTDPNRLFLFSGSNGLSVGQSPILDSKTLENGFRLSWKTYAERLEEAGISWKIYQGQDNFGDNSLEYFNNFQTPGTPLYTKARTISSDLVTAFKNDVANNTLPQVSWICAPATLSEHSSYSKPADGEDLTAQLLDALTSNPDVWSKTVFFLNYDENGGIFDHIPPPVPPCTQSDGYSSISTAGEVQSDGTPTGLGFRVPMIVISPWTRGGWVCSQVFDHTSVIRFMEARFGVKETNISEWRRAIVGDLTSAFDFKTSNPTWPPLPNTSGYRQTADEQCATLPYPTIPAPQRAATQESGTRPARPIPYEVHATARVDVASGKAWIDLYNAQATVSLYVYPAIGTGAPQRHTLGPGVSYSTSIKTNDGNSIDRYAASVHGPNGFFRLFSGSITAAQPTVQVSYDDINCAVDFKISNPATTSCEILVTDRYSGAAAQSYMVQAGSTLEMRWNAANTGNWYDLTITLRDDSSFIQRFAGHIENGQPSISEPEYAVAASPVSMSPPFNAAVSSAITEITSIPSIAGYATTNVIAASIVAFFTAIAGVAVSINGGIGSTLNTISSLLSGNSGILSAAAQQIVNIVTAGAAAASTIGSTISSFFSKIAATAKRVFNTIAQLTSQLFTNIWTWLTK
ncbi:phosphocholine-specific phospholipase C [Burkholderia territorii]|uniref:phosphocholine-specific phospholipase C n=1 Tax=Burkholderia territorii TaxID=1503055 RepID=UPI0009BD5BCE|nr:phospholipase C, phosphocholine-specific [Burkholderia territorii]